MRLFCLTLREVSEASAMNLFMVWQGVLVTPGVDQDILEGITRESVIAFARDMGIFVAERPVDKSELIVADEVCLTGSAARITAVKTIERFDLPNLDYLHLRRLLAKFHFV
jgi:branched-chain amino acid aminotransferase